MTFHLDRKNCLTMSRQKEFSDDMILIYYSLRLLCGETLNNGGDLNRRHIFGARKVLFFVNEINSQSINYFLSFLSFLYEVFEVFWILFLFELFLLKNLTQI
jgi:hypothetical protein